MWFRQAGRENNEDLKKPPLQAARRDGREGDGGMEESAVHVGACEGGRPLRDRRIMKEIREGEKGDVFKHNKGHQQFGSRAHEKRNNPRQLPYLVPSCCPLDNA